jgi:uncharacterized protein (DUF1778 family)
MEDSKTVTLSLRLPAHTHRAVSIAAARADKSVNQWIVDLAQAASSTANAWALLAAIRERSMVDEKVAREVMGKVQRLIQVGLDQTASQATEIQDLLEKLAAASESLEGVREIAAKRDQHRGE